MVPVELDGTWGLRVGWVGGGGLVGGLSAGTCRVAGPAFVSLVGRLVMGGSAKGWGGYGGVMWASDGWER